MKQLYSKLALLAIALLGTISLQAAKLQQQDAEGNTTQAVKTQSTFKQVSGEEIQLQKIAFYSQQLELTTEEAQKFWPLYNEYWAECGKARSRTMKSLKALNNATSAESKATDEEVNRLAQEYLANLNAESEIPLHYFDKFVKVMPVKKAAKIFYVEEKFRRMLIKQFRNPQPPKEK